ncbi:MAG: 2,3-oxidosqualene cyclase [Gemmataceae bacterium]
MNPAQPAPPQPKTVEAAALDRAIAHLLQQQHVDGCWEGEMVWCTMILSQYVIVRHITGRQWDEHTRKQIIRHYEVTRTSAGAWGLHPESAGYVFTTTLAYVALRLLGLGPDHALTQPARDWLHAQPGGVLAIPSWGKFWLALMSLYDYEGVNPVPPELFLLSPWLPIHPRRYYCHTRYIYLAMSYLYGSRYQADLGPIVHELRRELYPQPYQSIDFASHRHTLAAADLYIPPGKLIRCSSRVLAWYEQRAIRWLRRAALDHVLERIRYEQRVSRYQGLSPVNALLNCLALHAQPLHRAECQQSLEGLENWQWDDSQQGRRYAGARSHTWDTAFAMQALLAAPRLTPAIKDALGRAYRFLDQAQLLEEIPARRREHRDAVLGGWCFSDGRHRWPVSDCTAEALCAILGFHERCRGLIPLEERISDDRLRLGIKFLLSRQNRDGGFGTYERRRGTAFLEMLNPSEMFGQCMTELSYIECTASALSAMGHFRQAYPNVLAGRIEHAIRQALAYLRRCQRPDGSFPGFWGINFTYAIFHVVKGLRAVAVPVDDRALTRALDWLIDKQRGDGGWGEHYSSCLRGKYVEHEQSQVVMTSWALLALLEVLPPDAEPIQRGIAWLRDQQRDDGSWPRQAVNGVFFGTAMLDYRLYKSYFPTWALARYEQVTGSE